MGPTFVTLVCLLALLPSFRVRRRRDMASDLELRRFVPQRWEALESLLMASGYDFDPQGHPELPSHRHPFNAPENTRRPCDQVTPVTVIKEVLAVVAGQIDNGRLALKRS